MTSLRELALNGNRLSSLAPLAALSGLEVLLAAHNRLSSCDGVQVRYRAQALMVALPAADAAASVQLSGLVTRVCVYAACDWQCSLTHP